MFYENNLQEKVVSFLFQNLRSKKWVKKWVKRTKLYVTTDKQHYITLTFTRATDILIFILTKVVPSILNYICYYQSYQEQL